MSAADGLVPLGGEPLTVLQDQRPAQPPRDFADAEIGRVVLFLASDDAAYVTGQTLIVDGGVTLPEYPPGFPRRGGLVSEILGHDPEDEERAAILSRAWVIARLMQNAVIAVGEQQLTIFKAVEGEDGQPPRTVELKVTMRDTGAANRALELLSKEIDRQESGGLPPASPVDGETARQAELARIIEGYTMAAARPRRAAETTTTNGARSRSSRTG